MGSIGKVLKPKQHTEKHHRHEAAYELKEERASAAPEQMFGKKRK